MLFRLILVFILCNTLLSCESNVIILKGKEKVKGESFYLQDGETNRLFFINLDIHDKLKVVQEGKVLLDKIIDSNKSYIRGYTTSFALLKEKYIKIYINEDMLVLKENDLRQYKYVKIFPKKGEKYKIFFSNITPKFL